MPDHTTFVFGLMMSGLVALSARLTLAEIRAARGGQRPASSPAPQREETAAPEPLLENGAG